MDKAKNKSFRSCRAYRENVIHNNVKTEPIMISKPRMLHISFGEESSDEETSDVDTAYERNILNKKALSKSDTTYRLEKFKRNFLIIFNHEIINDGIQRLGTDKDVQALKNTFSKLDFEIEIYHDLRTREIMDVLKIFQEKDFTDYGCVAIAVLTHGGKRGTLMSKDGLYKETELINCFKTNNKPTLLTKPKILFIQASRCSDLTPAAVITTAPAATVRHEKDIDINPEKLYTLPCESDILIVYSSFAGTPSYRDETRGSWFIQVLCKKIDQLAEKLDLESIITEVKREVAFTFSYTQYNRDNKEMEIYKQMPILTSSLLRKLYLRKYGDDPPIEHSTHTKTDDSSSHHSCCLSHYSYIQQCLRYLLQDNPNDKTAQLYLNLSDTFADSDEFIAAKVQWTKTISEYIREYSKDMPYYKYIYIHKCENKD